MPDGAALAAAAELLEPLLPACRRASVRDAASRAQAGRTRVLLLGQAKRGKSTLANSLFGAPLLPTGALPLTSVATVVVAAPVPTAEVRYRDGRTAAIAVGEIGGLVSERGNPGNRRAVDQVRLTAPSRWLPPGTEVVDTPGTGSVHTANTAEARRALAALDVAVLVVAADPPASAAELDLLAEAATTASRSVVVVNKADLVGEAELSEIVEFTSGAVAGRLGGPVPVFPMAALPDRAHSEGFDWFAAWLQTELQTDGCTHALASTGRLLRREAWMLRDAVAVEQELQRRHGEHRTATVTALSEIVERAEGRARAVVDHLHGEARRLRRRLDEAHEQAVGAALAAATDVLTGHADQSSRRPPEDVAEEGRAAVAAMTRSRARAWYTARSADLADGLRAAVDRSLETLHADLIDARRAAGELLRVELCDVVELPDIEQLAAPSFEASVSPGWEELVSVAIKKKLPAGVRRRMVLRDLERWRQAAVPRPFGRSRSSLQGALQDALHTAERGIEATRAAHLAALRQGLAAVREDRRHSAGQLNSALHKLSARTAELDKILALLDGADRLGSP